MQDMTLTDHYRTPKRPKAAREMRNVPDHDYDHPSIICARITASRNSRLLTVSLSLLLVDLSSTLYHGTLISKDHE